MNDLSAVLRVITARVHGDHQVVAARPGTARTAKE
jgi:hypothetical protein